MRPRWLDAVSFGAGGFFAWMIGENHGLRLWQELVIGLCAAIAMGVLWRLAAFVVENRGRGASM